MSVIASRAGAFHRAASESPALDSWWLLSWGATLLRLPVLAITLEVLAARTEPRAVLALVMTLVFLDLVDGELHKLSSANRSTSLRNARRVADAIVDRLAIHSFFLVAIASSYGSVASAAYIPVLVREIPLIVLVSRTALSEKKILQANRYSKVASVLVAAIGVNIALPFCSNLILVPTMLVFGALGLFCYSFRGRPA